MALAYVALAAPVAAWRGLWHDEIFVYQVARQPTVAAIWQALAAGADNLPPHKAALLLSLALLKTDDSDAVQQLFDTY